MGLPALSNADTIGQPSLTINGWSPTLTQLGCGSAGSNGQSSCVGTNIGPGSGDYTLTSWNVYLDPDPTVVGFVAVQNNLAAAQTFTFTFLLPIVPQGPQVQVTGSISGSLTDANGNGATLTNAAPTSIYQAKIDGSTVQTLLDDPQNVAAGVFGSAPWGPGSFGPTVLGITANNNIAIQVSFTLSPGDLASFTSVFDVIAVPEPGTLLLLGSGLAGLVTLGGRKPRVVSSVRSEQKGPGRERPGPFRWSAATARSLRPSAPRPRAPRSRPARRPRSTRRRRARCRAPAKRRPARRAR